MFTDGITEAMNPVGELFGEEWLLASLRACVGTAPRDTISTPLRDIREFAGGAAPSDDITVLACRWHA